MKGETVGEMFLHRARSAEQRKALCRKAQIGREQYAPCYDASGPFRTRLPQKQQKLPGNRCLMTTSELLRNCVFSSPNCPAVGEESRSHLFAWLQPPRCVQRIRL